MYTCEKKCVNFKRRLHFCEHTLAAAETTGHLEEYLAAIQLEKSRETLQSVIERSRNQNAGEKSRKKRKGRNNTQSCPIIQQIPLYTAEYHNDNPFEISSWTQSSRAVFLWDRFPTQVQFWTRLGGVS